MKLYRLRSLDQYHAYSHLVAEDHARHRTYLDSLVVPGAQKFSIPGYSYPACKIVEFDIRAGEEGVNWRETVVCPITRMNNRMRAVTHFFDIEMQPYSLERIYITEQVTPFFRYLSQRQKNLVGSEFLGEAMEGGSVSDAGIRHEDITSLSFSDKSFDKVISLDVLEHVYHYYRAFEECFRILKPGGRMLWTVPFGPGYRDNSVRASINDSGEIIHHYPAEYHGDPVTGKGVLCYTHFGWQMLDQVREIGFSDAYLTCFYSEEFGYLGGDHYMFVAVK